MKLGILLQAREGVAFAYRLKLKDGLRAYKLRKELAMLEEEVKTFEKLKEDLIKATGKNEIQQTDPEFMGLVKTLNEAAEADIADPTPYIEENDLAGTEASAMEIEMIERLGLLKQPSAEPAPGPMPGPTLAK